MKLLKSVACHVCVNWCIRTGQSEKRRHRVKGWSSREACISSHRQKILVQSDSEAERLKVSVFGSSGTIFARLYGTFPNKKRGPWVVCVEASYLKYAGPNFCQPTPSRAWGETRLYQKTVMETQVCDWWRYHLPPSRIAGRSLTNDLMRVSASKRKWHESRADSGCNASRTKGENLRFVPLLTINESFLSVHLCLF